VRESWSIAEVVKMSGVTSRALRHWDAVGLLAPARTAADGRRFYGRAELLRLQRILLLRELGLGLPAIGEALARAGDRTAVLRRHRDQLAAERDRLTRLIRTVEDTIEGGEDMAAEKLFEGFDPYEAEARQRWGDEVVDKSYERMRHRGPQDAELARTGFERVNQALVPLLAAGVPADDERVQEQIALHCRVLRLFWEPDAEAYKNLGQMYVDDERYRRNIGGGNDALVDYLRDGMHVYADAHLAD
jgi:MerR family transcriptional regulator, thiopeptide resistance regulator